MKKFFLIPVLSIMLSCNNNSSDRTASQQEERKSDSIKSTTTLSVAKKDSIISQEKPIDKVDKNDISQKLIGTWTLKEGENATFEISKSTFYYPEHSTSYKYKIVGDSIKIKYDDFEGSFAFKFKTNDILVLTGDDGENTYHRIK
jgi:hypothetical protein